jgi:hypothetical protein
MELVEQSAADPERIPHMDLLKVAKELSPILASELAKHLTDTFTTPSAPATLTIIVQHCQHLKIQLTPTTVEKVVNQLALYHPNQALSLFMDDPHLRLERCLPLVAAIIASPSIPTETIVPLISRGGYFQGHKPKLPTNPRNLAFLHSLATMLSQSSSSSTSKLALISRVLDMFEDLSAVYTDSMRRALLHSEVISPLQRGERLGPTARVKVLRHIANTEGVTVCRKLELLLASWEARQVREQYHDLDD